MQPASHAHSYAYSDGQDLDYPVEHDSTSHRIFCKVPTMY